MTFSGRLTRECARLQQRHRPARSKRRSGQRAKVPPPCPSPFFSSSSLIPSPAPVFPSPNPPFLHHLSYPPLTPLFFPATTVKDKANHAVVLDKATSDKLYKDVQSYRLITVATLVDRLKINGSLARQALKDLEEKEMIKCVVRHSKLSIYSKWSLF